MYTEAEAATRSTRSGVSSSTAVQYMQGQIHSQNQDHVLCRRSRICRVDACGMEG